MKDNRPGSRGKKSPIARIPFAMSVDGQFYSKRDTSVGSGFITLLCLASFLLQALGTEAQVSHSLADLTAISISAGAHSTGTPLVHFWSTMVGAGRANEGLRSTWQEELSTARQLGGFQYVRMHGLFHDDMFLYREDENGKAIYNFQYLDDLFDRLLLVGVKPFVELGFVPKELSSVQNTAFWWQANGSPPNDNAKWAAMVRATSEHCIERYGREEVRSWYFEVWNEPNLTQPFFRGTQQQYFDLYRITSRTIKEIDPALRSATLAMRCAGGT